MPLNERNECIASNYIEWGVTSGFGDGKSFLLTAKCLLKTPVRHFFPSVLSEKCQAEPLNAKFNFF